MQMKHYTSLEYLKLFTSSGGSNVLKDNLMLFLCFFPGKYFLSLLTNVNLVRL